MRETAKWVGAVAVVIIVFALGFNWWQYYGPGSFHNKRYDVTFTVQRVEFSDRWGAHTNVWIETYGESGRVYYLEGHHEFKVGAAYRVVFVDKMRFNIFHAPPWWVWGRVELKEEIPP